ncbi:hypothetical protein COO91_08332 [Nostoc flagelliforme CCNUN1]|uniref:Uncharacterized protein n=1 Tax=Nostoc flagelliforme CCNUN1 TaxID=2038116 RepID=A0A2K8T3M3_9NOSO|nr:hypothetical protein COO91_08332 [Nostoc flagelliforme CCNUN1]
MKKPILSGLLLFCIFAENFSVIAEQQESAYKTKECTRKGITRISHKREKILELARFRII